MSEQVEVTQAELKPCPFCGREPRMQDYSERSDETGEVEGYAAVECLHGSDGGMYFHCDTLEQAIAAWNTRAQPAAPEGLVDELESVIHAWRKHGDWAHDKALASFVGVNSDSILAALRSAPAWRPISEAPKDKECLVFVPQTGEQFVAYNDGRGWVIAAGKFGVVVCEPTHFMPLPDAPAGGK